MLWRIAIRLLRDDPVARLVGSLANSVWYVRRSNLVCSCKRLIVSTAGCASICIRYCTRLAAWSSASEAGIEASLHSLIADVGRVQLLESPYRSLNPKGNRKESATPENARFSDSRVKL